MKRLLNELHRADRSHDFFPARTSILIALSGGPDSVCLTLLIKALRGARGLRIAAAHVDHGLRPGSPGDGKWVRDFCDRHGIPFHGVRADVRRRASARSESIEEAARRVRYQALLRIARKHRYASIATAHTADDQAETVLMRLASGCGLWGLAGIPPVRTEGSVRIIRPLLGVRKREVIDALKRAGVRYRTDRSNRSGRFLRNRVRHEVLPLLRERINPRTETHLSELAEDAGRWRSWAEGEALDFIRREGTRRGSRLCFDAAVVESLPEPLRVPVWTKVLELLSGREQHLRREHVRQIETLLKGSEPGRRPLAHGASVSLARTGRRRHIVWHSPRVR